MTSFGRGARIIGNGGDDMVEFRNSNQMKAYMKKEAERLDMNIGGVYTTFVARNFLEKVSKMSDQEIMIKGSSAEIAYLGRLVRAITDVDLALFNDFELNAPLLFRIINSSDGLFKFKLNRSVHRTPTGIYKMSLKGEYGTISQPLGLDIQDNYNRLIEPTTRMMPPIFEGDEPFYIYVPSFEEYLAEKLCIILESKRADVLNTRVKDFYDIYYWSQVFDFEGKVLQEAISETLQHRGTPYEKDSMEQIRAFDQNEFLQKLWNNYNPGSGLEKPDFSSVLIQIDRFISPVYEALLREDEFFGMWSSKENVWK